jgi:endonuclease III
MPADLCATDEHISRHTNRLTWIVVPDIWQSTSQIRRKVMETTEIGSRGEFALWAIQRAQEIVTSQGAAFAMAARDMDEKALATSAAVLGQAIADAMLEVFDGLMDG